MPQAARYLFDLDFSAPPEPEVVDQIEETPAEPMITVAEHERLLAEAIANARNEGMQEATRDRTRLAQEQSVEVQQAILSEIEMVYTEVGTLMERLERDASNLALAFASRFAERLVAQEPKTEILALLHQILSPLRDTPHISIRVGEDLADDIRTLVDVQMEQLGFKGKVTVVPDPVIMPGDCEVEWADGGIGRNLRAAIRQVEQLVEDHFAHVPEPEEDDNLDEAADETQDASQASTDAEDDTAAQDNAQADEDTHEQPTETSDFNADMSANEDSQPSPPSVEEDNPLSSAMPADEAETPEASASGSQDMDGHAETVESPTASAPLKEPADQSRPISSREPDQNDQLPEQDKRPSPSRRPAEAAGETE